MRIHAVHKLYKKRLAMATRPYLARGSKQERCEFCMIRPHLCICAHKPELNTRAAFMLVMYDDEVLKPSNTGRLIADLAKDTTAFLWSRLEPDEEMLAVLNDPKWQPYIVFPGEYTEPERVVNNVPTAEKGRRPLFIMLDGSWSQARKMFRKSRWMDAFPVLSFDPENLSRYRIRESAKDNQLATAEVAGRVFDAMGEEKNGKIMDLWFDVFKQHYLTGRMQRQLPEASALKCMQEQLALIKN